MEGVRVVQGSSVDATIGYRLVFRTSQTHKGEVCTAPRRNGRITSHIPGTKYELTDSIRTDVLVDWWGTCSNFRCADCFRLGSVVPSLGKGVDAGTTDDKRQNITFRTAAGYLVVLHAPVAVPQQ